MPGRVIDVGSLVDQQKIGAFHVWLVIVSFFIMMIDGFNLGAAAFAGPSLVKQFHVSPASLGTLFSAGLFAGLFGPPLFGACADRFGRKLVIIVGAIAFGIFTVGVVFSGNFDELIILRFIAGIGVSGILPTIVALNSEFAPHRYRATLVVIMLCGLTIGGGLPGLVAAHLVPIYGWHILFWISGVGPIILACILIFAMPESVRYLVHHPHRRAELVRTLKRLVPTLQVDANTTFIASVHHHKARMTTADLFAGRLAYLTPLFWIANLICLMVFNFTNSWLPTILADSGIGVGGAAIATALFQFGGTLGGLAIMRPLDLYGFLPLPILFLLAIPVLVCVGLPGLTGTVLFGIVFLAGVCIIGVQFGLIAAEGPIFPTAVRGRGIGSCFAAARVGATIGPFVGGLLIKQHLPLQSLFIVAAAPLIIGVAASAIITGFYRQQVRAVAPMPALVPQQGLGVAGAE
jgi:AAHS family 4-hydroxybenzoate transporter-like MFS transporter